MLPYVRCAGTWPGSACRAAWYHRSASSCWCSLV
jgi:hypothetical protein